MVYSEFLKVGCRFGKNTPKLVQCSLWIPVKPIRRLWVLEISVRKLFIERSLGLHGQVRLEAVGGLFQLGHWLQGWKKRAGNLADGLTKRTWYRGFT